MGKSFLMVRAADQLRADGHPAALIDLTAFGHNLDPEQWYDALAARLGRELGLEDALEAFWTGRPRLSPFQRWSQALRQVVPAQRQGPVVVFIDEIDLVRSLPFSTDEFFAGIRACYNARADDPELRRLTFCLLGVATPADLIRDVRITPFNISHSHFGTSPVQRGLPRFSTQLWERLIAATCGLASDSGRPIAAESRSHRLAVALSQPGPRKLRIAASISASVSVWRTSPAPRRWIGCATSCFSPPRARQGPSSARHLLHGRWAGPRPGAQASPLAHPPLHNPAARL